MMNKFVTVNDKILCHSSAVSKLEIMRPTGNELATGEIHLMLANKTARYMEKFVIPLHPLGVITLNENEMFDLKIVDESGRVEQSFSGYILASENEITAPASGPYLLKINLIELNPTRRRINHHHII